MKAAGFAKSLSLVGGQSENPVPPPVDTLIYVYRVVVCRAPLKGVPELNGSY